MNRRIPAPGSHGGDGPAVAAALGLDPDSVLDLSLTLNPFAPDPAPLVARAAGAVRSYPDVSAGETALAESIGIEPSRLVLTNGGSEAIALVAGESPRGRVEEPDFSLYRRHLTIDPAAPRWRSNPHSPTGALAGRDEAAAVWDEAFWPLSTGTWTRGDADAGSVVIGSLTKLFACPGLRLGYILAPDDATAARLRSRRPLWSVGSVALAVLPHLLAAARLGEWAAAIVSARRQLADELTGRGWTVEATDAPWVLVQGAAGMRDRLACHGVVVRDCTSFGLDDVVRIAVPSPAGLEQLCTALDAMGPDRSP